MKIAVCDDENECINTVELYLEKFKHKHKNVDWDVFYTGEEILSHYDKNGNIYDVIIMDIELNGISGIETAKQIRTLDKTVTIFFLTSHTKYAIECFKPSPKNFWVKPLKYDVFADDMEDVYKQITSVKNIFSFSYGDKYMRIEYEKILYISSDNKKIIVHTSDNVYEFNGALKKYGAELENENFTSPHKSYYVNLKHVKGVDGNYVTLSNEEFIPISKHRKKEFKMSFINYINSDGVT